MKMEQTNSTGLNPLIDVWEKIALENFWIKRAYDPPFNKSMLLKCNSPEELQEYLRKGNWCLGQGFYFQNICFINQIEAGDEWLTIKDDYAFESITFSGIIQRGEFMPFLNRLLQASKDQCLNLKY